MSANDAKIVHNDYLKIIAAAAMLIDHAAVLPGISNYPNVYITMRAIGRISFPIFAFFIARGFLNTRNIKNYILRLSICAVLSQLPYFLYFKDPLYLNIVFTFLISVFTMHFISCKRYIASAIFALIPLIAEISFGLYFDYSIYGVLCVAAFYLFIKNPYRASLAFSALTILFSLYKSVSVQLLSLFSLPIIFSSPPVCIKTPKYFFYYFYPVHLMVLYLLSFYLGR